MKAETTQTPEDVLNELRSLLSEAEKIIGQPAASAHDGGATFEAWRERLAGAQERLGAACAGAKRKVAAEVESADKAIRDHPYQSLAIALGIGLLAGVLLGRRASR